jgi:hypothetical protein
LSIRLNRYAFSRRSIHGLRTLASLSLRLGNKAALEVKWYWRAHAWRDFSFQNCVREPAEHHGVYSGILKGSLSKIQVRMDEILRSTGELHACCLLVALLNNGSHTHLRIKRFFVHVCALQGQWRLSRIRHWFDLGDPVIRQSKWQFFGVYEAIIKRGERRKREREKKREGKRGKRRKRRKVRIIGGWALRWSKREEMQASQSIKVT